MVQKRPFDNEESLEISSKFPRPLEGNDRLVSFLESSFPEYTLQVPHISEDRFMKADMDINENISEPRERNRDIDTGLPSCNSNSNSSWAGSITTEENSRPVEPVPVSFHPDRPIRTFVHREDVYSLLLHHPPQKVVAIGSNHQADIPPWSSPPHENMLSRLSEDENRLMGTSVIPMPDVELSSSYGDEIGRGRTNCSCEDGRSVRCVRQHIAEAREKLAKAIGPENFDELGFYDMGEQVGQQWSEKEEQLFHEVVFSNPASLGRNFWQSLSAVFPLRTKKQIISYYFNVFILRRRAQQNRNDSLDIDSDSDEWQGSDDYVENEHGITEEDEDSAVESPVYYSRFDYNQPEQRNLQDYDDESGELFDTREFSCHCEDMSKFSDKRSRSLLNYSLSRERDDSCTSSDLGTRAWKNSLNGSSSNETRNDYTSEWDSGFLSSFKTEVDFLPTCCVIEEVFGEEGSWNYKGKDGRA